MMAILGKTTPEFIRAAGLACYNSGFNRDATGIALHNGKRITVHKAGVPAPRYFASEMVKSLLAEKMPETQTCLIHARAATHGDPKNNVNNHPHFTKEGSVLTHKGVTTSLVKHESFSKCDSAQILLNLDKFGLEEGLKNITGSAILFYIPFYEPGFLYVYSNRQNVTVVNLKSGTTIVTTTILSQTKETLPLNRWTRFDLKTHEMTNGPKAELAQYKSMISDDSCEDACRLWFDDVYSPVKMAKNKI